MTPELQQRDQVRRVLVAVDASPSSTVVLEHAVRLARGFQAELVGLFVEEQELIDLAAAGLLHEVGLSSGAIRRLDTAGIELALRAQTRSLRGRLWRLAEREQIRWLFRSARGPVVKELLREGSKVELLVLGRIGGSDRRRGDVGSVARALLSRHRRGLVIVPPRGSPAGGVTVVLYDGSPESPRALATALRLSGESNQVAILPIGDEAGNADRLGAALTERFPSLAGCLRVLPRSRLSATAITDALDDLSPTAVVAPRDGELAREELLVELAGRLDSLLVIV